MKKIIALIFVLSLVLSLFAIVPASAEDLVLEGEWYPWKMDGKEITYGQVTTDDTYICKEFSSNWKIEAQSNQQKITETYMSPATVWTVDTNEDFVLAFKVKPGSHVEIGFLHCVGQGNENAGYPVLALDGSDAGEFITLEYSTDGTNWSPCTDAQFNGGTADAPLATLTVGMTGFTAPHYTHVGNGTQQYDEAYFTVEGTVGQTANYVRFVYAADGRYTSWDPVVRDAIVTAPAIADESETGNVETGDATIVIVLLMAVSLAMASIVFVKVKR